MPETFCDIHYETWNETCQLYELTPRNCTSLNERIGYNGFKGVAALEQMFYNEIDFQLYSLTGRWTIHARGEKPKESTVMQKITPHLWFDKEAIEAARFYSSIFDDSKITHESTIHDTPSGDSEIVGFTVLGYEFMAINAGPLFGFNPSISFMVNFDPSQDKNARKRIDEVWEKLSRDGKALMPLDKYPFSERYGWIEDRYGVSWQLIYTDPEGEERPVIIPSLMFVGDMCGKAEEATDFYLSVFGDSKRGAIARYPAGMEPDKEGTVMFTDFNLQGQWFAAMDSAQMHDFAFNEAISLMVQCKDQEEIDYFWDKLSAVPEAEQCGWIKDKFGVSWQIIPANMGELMSKNPEKTAPAMLKMKKIIIAGLEKAGEEDERSG